MHNQVRISGGQWRGRRVMFAPTTDLRPTTDRVRQTLFNWLGHDLEGQVCLDLFAGSGILGFEALSRRARRVVMVERSRRACQQLIKNTHLLGASQEVQIIQDDALLFLRRLSHSQNGPQHTPANIPTIDGATQNPNEIEKIPSPHSGFHLIFCDPPYQQNYLNRLWESLARVLRPDGWLYAESDQPLNPPAYWNIHRQGNVGMAYYHLMNLV